MSEVKKCVRCGGELIEEGRLIARTRVLAGVSLAQKGDIVGDRIIPYYCRECGYIEFYKEMKLGEQASALGFLKRCVKCSRQIPIASEECQYCGAKQKQKEE